MQRVYVRIISLFHFYLEAGSSFHAQHAVEPLAQLSSSTTRPEGEGYTCIVKKTATRTPTPHHILYSKGKYIANVQGKASKKMQRFLWLSIIISSEFQLGIVETTLKCGMQLVICFLSLAREPMGVSNTSSRTHSTVQSAA